MWHHLNSLPSAVAFFSFLALTFDSFSTGSATPLTISVGKQCINPKCSPAASCHGLSSQSKSALFLIIWESDPSPAISGVVCAQWNATCRNHASPSFVEGFQFLLLTERDISAHLSAWIQGGNH
uniref:Putative secreted protein n=1 Tax=Amblyomma americanum TaxID=6943 RepID=A0A0C9SDE6_AMBAM